MGLTLPGVLGRFFTAATDLFQSSKTTGDSFPSFVVLGDGRLLTSDGSEDLTNPALDSTLPTLYVRARSNRYGLTLRGEHGGSVQNIFTVEDFFGAPIAAIANAGGLFLNDNLKIAFGAFGPNNVFGDIYGHLQLGSNAAIRCSKGPPGNILSFPDATGELFQRARTSQQGSWTATNATYSARDEGAGFAPSGFRFARAWTASSAATVTARTATGTSGYPVPANTLIAGQLQTKSATVARSKQAGLAFYDATGAQIGSTTFGTAAVDSTSAYTTYNVQAYSPSGTATCALVLQITSPANGEAHWDTCAGIWVGLTSSAVTAWNPPYVFRMDAFGGVSATGLNDGAFVGDVMIRADGPSNVVQRFWTCAVAGKPWQQVWVSDPRLYSSPARVNWYGGSYLQQGVPTDPDYVLPLVALGMLHNDPPDSVNRGVVHTQGQYQLLNDSSTPQAFGGMAMFTEIVRKKAGGAPYVSKDGMFAFMYGLWDLQAITSGSGAAGMSQLNGYSSTPGGSTSSIVNTLRDMICHARASVILPYSDSSIVLAGNTLSGGAFPYAFSNGSAGAGGQFTYWLAPQASAITHTIKADFAGGEIDFSFLGAPGAFGGTVTWSGTLFSVGGVANPGTISTSNVEPPGSRGRVVVRFKNLTSANAGQTIIATIASVDGGGGNVSFDAVYYQGQFPNLVAILGMPRLATNAAYASLAGAGSYWNSNSGSSGDGDVTTLNASLQSLVAEFDANVFYVDSDSGTLKQAANFAADGFTLGAFGVHAIASQFISALQAQLPLINFRNVNHDYHDTSVAPVGAPFFRQGALSVTTGVSRLYADDYYQLSAVRASVNTPPIGSAAIIDVLKNGVTIFSTAGNRPSIAAGANTAVSAAAPDVQFLAPGDYLTVSIAQVGSTTPGADLTVNVLGRKIPIP